MWNPKKPGHLAGFSTIHGHLGTHETNRHGPGSGSSLSRRDLSRCRRTRHTRLNNGTQRHDMTFHLPSEDKAKANRGPSRPAVPSTLETIRSGAGQRVFSAPLSRQEEPRGLIHWAADVRDCASRMTWRRAIIACIIYHPWTHGPIDPCYGLRALGSWGRTGGPARV